MKIHRNSGCSFFLLWFYRNWHSILSTSDVTRNHQHICFSRFSDIPNVTSPSHFVPTHIKLCSFYIPSDLLPGSNVYGNDKGGYWQLNRLIMHATSFIFIFQHSFTEISKCQQEGPWKQPQLKCKSSHQIGSHCPENTQNLSFHVISFIKLNQPLIFFGWLTFLFWTKKDYCFPKQCLEEVSQETFTHLEMLCSSQSRRFNHYLFNRYF